MCDRYNGEPLIARKRMRSGGAPPIERLFMERFNLSAAGEVRFVDGIWVSGNYFHTLGVEPLLGRLIQPEDDRADCASVAVISYALWQREFGGRPDIVGQTMAGVFKATIIGVTRPEFFGIEVGRQFSVTRERIRQIEAKALRKMRHPTRLKHLHGFLEIEQPQTARAAGSFSRPG